MSCLNSKCTSQEAAYYAIVAELRLQDGIRAEAGNEYIF